MTMRVETRGEGVGGELRTMSVYNLVLKSHAQAFEVLSNVIALVWSARRTASNVHAIES